MDRYIFLTMGILYSYKCNIRCGHCITDASPEREEKMSLDYAKDIIIQAHRAGVKVIGVTGGEPFLFYDDLYQLAVFSSSLPIPLSVVTNAFWAKNKLYTLKMLRTLAKAGLKSLTISTDTFHLKFIGMDKIINAVISAQEMGIKYRVQISCDPQNKITNYLQKRIPNIAIRRSYLCMEGRATSLKVPLSVRGEYPVKFCLPAFSSPVAMPSGDIIACCRAGINFPLPNSLVIGNLYYQTLEEILNRLPNNFLWRILRVMGPLGVYFSLRKGGFISNNFSFSLRDPCNLCAKLLGRGNMSIIYSINGQLMEDKELHRKLNVYEILFKRHFKRQLNTFLSKIYLS